MSSRRLSILIAVTLVAVAVAASVFTVRRGARTERAPQGDLLQSRAFLSDSLGISLRLPASKGWSLRRSSGVAGEPVVAAIQESELATVKIFAAPNSGDTRDLEGVLRRRQAQMATLLGAQDFDSIIEAVVRSEKHEMGGYPAMQWQATTVPIVAADEKRSKLVFMWLLIMRPAHVFECIGMVRHPAEPTEAEKAETDALLRDVAFILQSFQVR